MKNISLSMVQTIKLGRTPVEVERVRGGKRQRRNARLSWRNPLCVMCEAEGRVSRATEWDHIVPLCEGGADSEQNLQGLCHTCHVAKTTAEAVQRATGQV